MDSTDLFYVHPGWCVIFAIATIVAALILWFIVSYDDGYPLRALIPKFSSRYTALVIASFVLIALNAFLAQEIMEGIWPDVGRKFDYEALVVLYVFLFHIVYGAGRYFARQDKKEFEEE